MAGQYQSVPLGRDYSFTSNVASRLTEVGNNLTGSTLYFLAKQYPDTDLDSAAIVNVTPTANNVTNVVTVSIPRVNTNLAQPYPDLFWEISCLTANNLYYTLDQGRMAITQPVRDTVP